MLSDFMDQNSFQTFHHNTIFILAFKEMKTGEKNVYETKSTYIIWYEFIVYIVYISVPYNYIG